MRGAGRLRVQRRQIEEPTFSRLGDACVEDGLDLFCERTVLLELLGEGAPNGEVARLVDLELASAFLPACFLDLLSKGSLACFELGEVGAASTCRHGGTVGEGVERKTHLLDTVHRQRRTTECG